MIRILIICFAICCYSTASAQDWLPFPQGAVLYYSSGTDTQKVYLDSAQTTGNEQHFYYSKKLRTDSCIVDVSDVFFSLFFEGYSLVEDSVFNKSTGVKFLPFAKVNETWAGNSTYTFRVVDVREESVLGQPDSVKYFTISPSQSASDTIRLSKRFGLLDLHSTLWNAGTNDTFWKLIGFEDKTIRVGYKEKEFHEYFNFSPGDVFFYEEGWLRDDLPPWIYPGWEWPQNYFQDSVTLMIVSLDSVHYEYTRVDWKNNITNGTMTYYPPDQKLSQVHSYGLLTFSKTPKTSWSPWPSPSLVWQKNGNSINCLRLAGHVENCSFRPPFEHFESMGFYSDCGQEYRMSLSVDPSVSGRYLKITGTIINGVHSGKTSLPTGINEKEALNVKVYPNPATKVISIDIAEQIAAKVYLTDVTGRKLLQQGFNGSTTINIGHLSPGIYLLHITTDTGKVHMQKVVKN